jgi:orotate phosphoribosyltransferase
VNAIEALERSGAYYSGEHFVLKSGKHSEVYYNPDDLLPYPYLVDRITSEMAAPFLGDHDDLVCVGPDFGGNYLAWDVARHLSRDSHREVKWIATVKLPEGGFRIEPDRGFEKILIGSDVLIAEDLLTTGSSVLELIGSLTQYLDFNLIGVTVAVNRGGLTAEDLRVPKLHAAADITVEADEPDECRWCAMERPIISDMGHGNDYAETHHDYAGGYKLLRAA